MKITLLFEAALGIAAGYFSYGAMLGNPDAAGSIASAFATVSGTLIGFLIAALSILTALTNHQLVKNLRKTGHYDSILRKIYWTAFVFILVLAISLSALFVTGAILVWAIAVPAGFMAMGIVMLVATGRELHVLLSAIKD